mmetsp:Transcript_23585/g.22731  ORF Transcript_23585/g.22731 Transcript_23585/m.22731 type:complete len:499 (-) Transcript_23585:485-1981(-)
MDSDNCDVIIKVLSNVLSRLIDVNKSHTGQQLITKFQSSYPPEVSIHAYLERIKKYARCSDSCFVVALIYIDRMIEIRNVVLTSLNVHRLIITSLMLAAKFFDDLFYNNAFYAKLGGVAPLEMNSLELDFLQLLNFSLFVTPEVYSKYHAELRNYVGVVNIPVYLSPSFPNSPKLTKGNTFLSRPPSTSPLYLPLEIARFPSPSLLEGDLNTQNTPSYYRHLLESNPSNQIDASQNTFITSALLPCEENRAAPFCYNIPSGGQPYNAPYNAQVGSNTMGNQFYQNNNQSHHQPSHFTYQKPYPSDVSNNNGLQQASTPVPYSHETLQMSVLNSQPTEYSQSNLENEKKHCDLKNGGPKESVSQTQYYPPPFPLGQASAINGQLSPLGFVHAAILANNISGRDQVQVNGYPSHPCDGSYYDQSNELSFSDDNYNSGTTTPLSAWSSCPNSARSSCAGLNSTSSESSMCSPNNSFFPLQSGGPYHIRNQKLQQPHYIIAS